MSWLSSALTAPGTNAAKSQSNRTSNVAKQAGAAYTDASSLQKDWLETLKGLNLGTAFGGALNAINQPASQKIDQFGRQASESAANNAAQYANYLKSQGYGDGLQQGAGQGFYQNAATQTNQYAQQVQSPQYQQQQLMALIQALMGGNNAYSGLTSNLASQVYGQPQAQVGQSPLAGLGSILGGLF